MGGGGFEEAGASAGGTLGPADEEAAVLLDARTSLARCSASPAHVVGSNAFLRARVYLSGGPFELVSPGAGVAAVEFGEWGVA